MLSNSIEKHIRKLKQKKYRYEYGEFIAEGPKVVNELMETGLKPKYLLTTASSLWDGIKVEAPKLRALSQLESSNEVLAVFDFPNIKAQGGRLKLILDRISDPGNLGTIVRTCDWFGVSEVYCTPGTTDIFNAKCVQSTMGSIARVKVEYIEDEELLTKIGNCPLWLADIEGQDVRELEHSKNEAFIVMGSESHGVSEFWKQKAQKITIPKIGKSPVESLNVAVATAIILSRLS